jgi:hypothetical protein
MVLISKLTTLKLTPLCVFEGAEAETDDPLVAVKIE